MFHNLKVLLGAAWIATPLLLFLAASRTFGEEDVECAPGMLIVRFQAQYMPSENDVSLQGARFGIRALDSLLTEHAATRMQKYLPTYNRETSVAGRHLEQTFIVYYEDGTDPAELVDEFARFPHFEEVTVNRRLTKHYGGTRMLVPKDKKFPNQWNLHSASNDSLDIDAPEGWSIETGNENVVIGIVDLGTVIDLDYLHGVQDNGSWKLKSDITFLFNDAEDNNPKSEVGNQDLDGSDAAQDADTLRDNVIGYTFTPLPAPITDPLQEKFWKSMPHHWLYTNHQFKTDNHGIAVASIAAAVATFTGTGGDNIAGIANDCKVYVVRDGSGYIASEIQAIIAAAYFADVINMSWWFNAAPVGMDYAITWAAEEKDCVLIAITGNGSGNVGWPGRFPEVLAVGNMGTNLQLYESRYGPNIGDVSVVAPVGPGIPTNQVTSCLTQTNPLASQPCDFADMVMSFDGTSAAAPQAAGVAALIRSRFPTLDQQEVRERIMRSAEYYWSSSQEDSLKFGHGKINAYRALTEWGEITEDTTWDPDSTADGAYYVSGDLSIKEGATLTIMPGTTIKIAPDNEQSGPDTARVQIVVEGTLEALGTSDNEIVFESFTDTTSQRYDWVGIKFTSTSEGTLEHVEIRNAQVGVENYAPITIADCVFDECETGIESHDDIAISTSTVKNITDAGIRVLAGDADLYGVTIRDSDLDGLVTGSGGTVSVSDSYFLDCVKGVSADSIETAGGSLTIGRSVIQDNTVGIKCDYSHVVVESTEVATNTVGVSAIYNANPDLGHESGGSSVGHNSIHHQDSRHIQNYSGLTVKAEKNWWRGVEPGAWMFYGDVDYNPWLTGSEPDIQPHEEPGEVAPFISENPFPAAYELSYSYPNPFNPTTRIRYEVPAPGGQVRIVVYNVNGQVVKTLVQGQRPPGTYSVFWDGRNERGETTASGVYFVRMQAGAFQQTRKLVLLK